MDAPAKRPGSITFLLVGLVLLVMVAGLFVTFVPVVDCPGPSHHGMGAYYENCPRCGKMRGVEQQITLLRRWFWRPTPEQRAEYEAEFTPLHVLLARVPVNETAEEAFKRIEESIEKARTIRIKYTEVMLIFANGAEGTSRSSGELLIGQGNKVRASHSVGEGAKSSHSLMVSDGSTVWQQVNSNPPERASTPGNLRGLLIPRLCRRELFAVRCSIWARLAIDDEMTAANDTVAISNLASGPDDGAVRTLAHGRQFGKSTDPFQVTTKLWYDPKTFGITKRTIDAVHGGTRRFVTETFEEFTLNADIPDEKFKLPEEKK